MAEEEPSSLPIEEGEGELPLAEEAEAPMEGAEEAALEDAPADEGEGAEPAFEAAPEGGETPIDYGDAPAPEGEYIPAEGEEIIGQEGGEEYQLPADGEAPPPAEQQYGEDGAPLEGYGEHAEGEAGAYGGGEYNYDHAAEGGEPAAYVGGEYSGEAAYGGATGGETGDPYGAYGGLTDHADAARAVGTGGMDVDALLAGEREKHEQQLKMETAAREELEDMILRIEKHFKAEQAARKKAEELLQAAIAAEMDAKNKLEDVMKKRQQEQKVLDEERNAITRERHALESMRQEFENELQAARSEVAKAQEALAGSEERIRAAEQVERARLESEYQAKLGAMQVELDRTRDEMSYRTMVMQDEMEKWRQQAHMTANAVLEAKNEVMDRKRELDSTKDKMDRLLDKLLIGRERGIELSGAIASNQRMMSMLPGSLPPMGGHKQPLGQQQAQAQGGWMMPAQPQYPAAAQRAPVKLPPMDQASPPLRKAPLRRAASQDRLQGGGNSFYNEDAGAAAGGNLYEHVQSKVFQSAAEVGLKAKPKSAKKKNAKPDRFEEAKKEASRSAAMARW